MPKRSLPPRTYQSGKANSARGTTSIKTHVVPFVDHASRPARMVFSCREDVTLPPILGFPVYFTQVDVPGDDTRSDFFHGFIFGNTETPSYALRLDLYFLPGAQINDCIEHYHAELQARGNFMAQIRSVGVIESEDAIRRKRGTHVQLPGIPPSYRDESDPQDIYDGMLYFCDEPDWSPPMWALRCVRFGVNMSALEKLRESSGEEVNVDPIREVDMVIRSRIPGQVMVDGVLLKMAEIQAQQNGWWAAWNHAAYEHGWKSW